KLDALDSHLLRLDTRGRVPETGIGSGVQLEAIASYALSDSFSIGLGGRYWYLQANGHQDLSAVGGTSFSGENIKMQRFGVFVQGTYTFGLPDRGRRSPWLSCC